MKNNSVYILGVEAKDLYNANHLINAKECGYETLNTKNYLNALDYSLDLIKLREIYEKVYRNKKFSFTDGRKEYTKTAIVVKFNYAYKEYNRAIKDVFVKAGYIYRDIKDNFVDGVYFDEQGELIGIEINKKVDGCTDKELPKYFKYDINTKTYILVKEPNVLKTKAELRQDLYKNGFMCNGIYYIRDKRSSGSSRVGKCMFIDQKLYKNILKWEMCGLSVKDGDEIDLAAFESYIALPSSSCIDTLELIPENFLVINDYESVFTDKVIAVEYKDGQLVSSEQDREIRNSIFDGESIMDESMFADYPARSMLLLRNRFFKSACFKGKIQKWFSDNNITDISQLNGFTLAKDIKDIKIITTPSSIKYVKFGSLRQWFDNLNTTFGIVKHEKPTHYLDGKMVQCHYQLLNTLHLSRKEIQQILQPNLDYISLIRKDPDILKYHIKYPYDEIDNISPMKTKNEIIFKLLGINSDFAKTKIYYDFRNDLVKSMIDNVKQGHIWISGNYSTLLGNGIEMLQHAIGKFNGESVIGLGNIHSSRFKYNQTILGSRSPHICPGNVLLVNNAESDLIDTYFDLSNEVVYINSIGENILQRLNGADFDSDSILLTDNQILINAAKRNYGIFKVPTCFVTAQKTKRCYTAEDKSDLDIKTSVNKIGEIVNLSQMLNSIMWDNINRKLAANKDMSPQSTIRENLSLYNDICILAVMSGIEIDRAKKEFEVSAVKEIDRLKKKYLRYQIEKIPVVGSDEISEIKRMIKPLFFKMITLNNGYSLNPAHIYQQFETPMDYLQEAVGKFNFRKNKDKDEVIPFLSIIEDGRFLKPSKFHYEKKDKIIDRIIELKKEMNSLYIGYYEKPKDKREKIKRTVMEKKQECIDYINDVSLTPTTMYLLLKEIDEMDSYRKEQKRQEFDDEVLIPSCSRLIFGTLFGTPNEIFYDMIDQKPDKTEIVADKDGEINLFGYNYTKTVR